MFASQTNIKTAKDWQVATEIHNGARVLMKRDNYQLHSSEANGIYQNFGIRLNTSSSCIPSVTTVPHGGQIIVYSVSQHCTIWRSDHRVFHLSTPHHMAVRSLCIIPVNTIPHGTQIVYSTSEQCTTWWSDRAFRQPVLKWLSQYHFCQRKLRSVYIHLLLCI